MREKTRSSDICRLNRPFLSGMVSNWRPKYSSFHVPPCFCIMHKVMMLLNFKLSDGTRSGMSKAKRAHTHPERLGWLFRSGMRC